MLERSCLLGVRLEGFSGGDKTVGEIIADLERRVVSPDGDNYDVQVAAERLPDGIWAAWLEFVPVDDSLEVQITRTETTQPTREHVLRWSKTLTDVYIEGAFTRRVHRESVSGRAPDAAISGSVVSIDPFEVLRRGRAALRARLRLLTRPDLLAIIETYGLNPAQANVTPLSDSQLVTFIITATDVQARRRQE